MSNVKTTMIKLRAVLQALKNNESRRKIERDLGAYSDDTRSVFPAIPIHFFRDFEIRLLLPHRLCTFVIITFLILLSLN